MGYRTVKTVRETNRGKHPNHLPREIVIVGFASRFSTFKNAVLANRRLVNSVPLGKWVVDDNEIIVQSPLKDALWVPGKNHAFNCQQRKYSYAFRFRSRMAEEIERHRRACCYNYFYGFHFDYCDYVPSCFHTVLSCP
jgi:hypothetical protein